MAGGHFDMDDQLVRTSCEESSIDLDANVGQMEVFDTSFFPVAGVWPSNSS
jgi:hypothetical protein